ncbi:MAG TPA: S41 family peptidase [Gemmatimonadales bacterium]|nr:S41 family peptidase [Gemmatimonadales bacterium]
MTVSTPRARWLALTSIVAIACLSGGWLLRAKPAAGGGVYQQARLFENVVGAINHHYIDSLGEGDLYERAAEALVASLKDPYAELLINESYREYQRQMTGTEVDLDLGRGATESGFGSGGHPLISRGDEILSIDGTSTVGWSTSRIEEALRNSRRSTVTVLVRAPGSDRPVVREITRTSVHVPAASPGVLLNGGVGYVTLRRMSEGASDELRTAVDRLRAEGMHALVLDLRSNPGGLIREGVKVASLFLQPGDTVAVSRGRTGKHLKAYLADESGGWEDLRLAVLVNRGTASSAEVVAGALQDHDRAVLVGTPTYGKGVLQTTYPLGDEVAIKLTTARWYTPTGRWVQRPQSETTGAPGNRTPAMEPQVFRTPMGRPIPDQSGILPDLMVRTSFRSDGERTLHLALGDDLDRFRQVLSAYAAELRTDPEVSDESFVVTQAMRDTLYARLVGEGVPLARDTYDAAAPYVAEQLGYEVTRELFGTESVVRRQAKGDRQLQAALRIVRTAGNQQEAITSAVATQASGRAR